MSKKIVGWILLVSGILLIAWGVWSSSQIFTAKKLAPEVFKAQNENQNEETSKKLLTPQEQIQQDMQGIIQEQLGNMLPKGSVSSMLNLIAWSIFMTILIFAGGKVAMIGVKLLK